MSQQPALPRGIDTITIHPNHEGKGFVVYGWGEYEESSVLAGQDRKLWLGTFDTIDQARKEWPMAHVDEDTAPRPSGRMPLCPPRDFDPMDAGEAWGPDDY